MFITLLTQSLEGSRAFYKHLGYAFEREQHGNKGPMHYSTTLPDITLEIYPPLKSLGGEDRFFIGIPVAGDADTLKRELIEKHGGTAPEPDIPTTKSGIATLRDPAGILVRLFPK